MMVPVMMMVVVPVTVMPANMMVPVRPMMMAVHVPVVPVLHLGRLRDRVALHRGGDARGRQRCRLRTLAGRGDQQDRKSVV